MIYAGVWAVMRDPCTILTLASETAAMTMPFVFKGGAHVYARVRDLTSLFTPGSHGL